MDNELVCNFKKCRKRLSGHAWITSCSHIFCDEDGRREFNRAYTCPACETNLPGKLDIIGIDLEPSEQYKSMVLAGHKPETIMEICSRALAFWTYQNHQERTYQEYIANKAKERTVQLEQYYEQIVNRTQTELNSLRTQVAASKKELEKQKKVYHEISEKMMEKNRQYQKLQTLYDALRRKCITPTTFDVAADQRQFSTPSGRQQHAGRFDLPMATGDDLLRRFHAGGDHNTVERSRSHSPPEKEFVLKPTATPILTTTEAGLSLVHSHFHVHGGTPQAGNPSSRKTHGSRQ